MKIAIVGTGISTIGFINGLHGEHEIDIYDKSRKPGGRLTLHHLKTNNEVYKFNLGAQYVHAKTLHFKKILESAGCTKFNGSIFDFKENKLVDSSKFYIHKDGLQSIVENALCDFTINQNCKIIKICKIKNKIYLNKGDAKKYDLIVSSLPLPQLIEILQVDLMDIVEYSKCLAVGINLKNKLPIKSSGFKNISEKIGWSALSSSFCESSALTINSHFISELSDKLFDENEDKIVNIAKDDILKALQIKRSEFGNIIKVFRWRYALCDSNYTADGYMKITNNIYAIGDWAIAPRVESAYESGRKAAIALNI